MNLKKMGSWSRTPFFKGHGDSRNGFDSGFHWPSVHLTIRTSGWKQIWFLKRTMVENEWTRNQPLEYCQTKTTPGTSEVISHGINPTRFLVSIAISGHFAMEHADSLILRSGPLRTGDPADSGRGASRRRRPGGAVLAGCFPPPKEWDPWPKRIDVSSSNGSNRSPSDWCQLLAVSFLVGRVRDRTKIDYRRKGTLILTSLPEVLGGVVCFVLSVHL